MRTKKLRCDFCNKIITKENYKTRDRYDTYIVCKECFDRTKDFEKEYNALSIKITENYRNQMENMVKRLRLKYKLISRK